jgi:hypothetical protein
VVQHGLARWLNAELLGVVFMKYYMTLIICICLILIAYSFGRQQAFHDMNRLDLASENLQLNKQIQQYVKSRE